MHLYSVMILRQKPETAVLASASDLSSFSFFQRGTMSEMMTYMSKLVASRTNVGQRQKIEEKGVTCFVHAMPQNLTGVVVTDAEYPTRVAFSLIAKMVDGFHAQYPNPSPNGPWPYPELSQLLVKYQNPHEADNILKVQKELDETKDIVNKTMTLFLERGEKLDDMVAATGELSMSSKLFYKQAKKTNSCCLIS